MIGQRPVVIHSTLLWVWNHVSGTFSRFMCTVSWNLAGPFYLITVLVPVLMQAYEIQWCPALPQKLTIWRCVTGPTFDKHDSLRQTGKLVVQFRCINAWTVLLPTALYGFCQAIAEKFDLVLFHSDTFPCVLSSFGRTKAALIPASFPIQVMKRSHTGI